MMRAVGAACLLCLLGHSWPAAAAQPERIVVGPFRRDENKVLSQQLTGALCAAYRCVPRGTVLTDGKLDLTKVQAAGVAGIISGTITTWDGKRRAWVALRTVSAEPQRDWSFELQADGTLPEASVQQLQRELAVELAHPRSPPARAALPAPVPPPAAAKPSSGKTRTAPPPPPAPAATVAALAPAPPMSPAPAAAPAVAPAPLPASAPPRAPGGPPLLAIEGGLSLLSRTLDYGGLTPPGTTPLRTFDAAAIWAPRLHLEVYPAAHAGHPLLAGLGLLAEYEHSVGLQTRDTETGTKHPTTYSQLRAGLLWRVQPAAGSRLLLFSSASYVKQTLTVEAVDGQAIPGLPDTDLSGWALRLGVEYPLSGRWTILAGGGYVGWTEAQDLVSGSPAFFPGGSAHALEADGGAAFALSPAWSVRALLTYASTAHDLDPDPTGTYVASGATDRMIGGRLMVRWER